MVDIDIAYQGELRCRATHRPSSTVLTSDAPLDNQGRGESFSPTDLVATALGTCMLTLMGIRSRERGWNLDGTTLHVKKTMTTSPPRKIARLETEIRVPQVLDEAARKVLEHAAHTCPVRLSIAESIEVPVRFEWGS
ncbi:MAG TPA: OsmC family protein [Polyangiaceae bacterium]|jgi:putative redox protein|nr:OsmC family protein [Polyangiaceae bacterium]